MAGLAALAAMVGLLVAPAPGSAASARGHHGSLSVSPAVQVSGQAVRFTGATGEPGEQAEDPPR